MTHGRATAPVATIVGVALTTVRVSAKTQWIFLELADDQGRLGHGEATLQRREAAVAERVVSVATAYLGQPVDPQ
jgi:L-alanine-DL-glutamate epimerase-like enolase superfamily enzyme